jgi:putative PIN family toxin of toxin-antitoxin system
MLKPLVVVDTNIFISGLIIPRGYPYLVMELWRNNHFELATSSYIIQEISEVLTREKIKKKYHLSPSVINKVINLLHESALIIHPKRSRYRVRDHKDQVVLDTAITARAHFLITGDEDLLFLSDKINLGRLCITTAKKFIEQHS